MRTSDAAWLLVWVTVWQLVGVAYAVLGTPDTALDGTWSSGSGNVVTGQVRGRPHAEIL